MNSTPVSRPNARLKEAAGTAWLLLTGWLMLGSVSPASTITGTVTNLSRNKPPSGDDVVLYRVDKSMHEVMRAKTDARGMFQFEAPGVSRYLVAAIHEKVSYHTPLLSGSDPVTVVVYDAVTPLAAVHESSTTLFPAREDQRLKITQFFVVSNTSAPPRTLISSFTFQLPPGAVLDSAAVQPPDTLPFIVTVSACGVRRQYCVASPIRPGETKVRIIYHLEFHGVVPITLPLPHSVNQVLVKIPESLRLQANGQAIRNEGQQNGLSVYSITGLQRGQPVSFELIRAIPKATGANGETMNRFFQPHDADYEIRPQMLKTVLPTTASPPDGRSPFALMVWLSVLLSALFLGGARLSRSSVRSQVPERSLFRKA